MRTPYSRSHRILSALIPAFLQLVHAVPKPASLTRFVAASTPIPFGATEESPEPVGSEEFWWKIGISGCFVLLGGVFAGLTLGLMGLDELHLRVLASSSEDTRERQNAVKVLRLLGKGRHWVLVVLLLGNVIVNESLPIFLDSAIGGGVSAIIFSTLAIVVFGEIIPQAVSVRYGLSIGATCAPLVLALMYIFAPVAWPTAKLLDWALGANEANTYKKAELKSFLQFHRTGEEPLRDDEISILNGVLELNTKNVASIMTPIGDVVTLSTETILDHKRIDTILLSGFSRFPVHEPGNESAFVGLLLIKKLLKYDPAQEWPVSKFQLSILPEAHPEINCFQALDYFQTGRAHLLLISDTPGRSGGAIGVLTLEDIIEEIISEEIVDETDRFEDNQSKRKARRMTTASIMRGIVERRIGAMSSTASPRLGPVNDNDLAGVGNGTPGSAARAIMSRGGAGRGEGSPLLRANGDEDGSVSASYGAMGVSESPKGI